MQIRNKLAGYAIKAANFLLPPNLSAGFMMAIGGTYSIGDYKNFEAYNSKIVYAAVNILVSKLNETSILVGKESKRKSLQKYYKSTPEARKLMTAQKELQELETHPLILLLENPNSYQTGIELFEHFWINYEFGDGYLIPEYPGEESRMAGQPIAMHSISRARVSPVQSQNDPYAPIEYYNISLRNGQQIVLYPNQIIHLKKSNPNEDLFGFNPVTAAAPVISKNNANQIAQGAAFKNGGRGTLFSSDMGVSEGAAFNKSSAEQMSSLKQTMQQDFQGAHNNRRMYYTNGYVNAQNYGDTLAEMELVEAEKADWRDIFAVFQIPTSLAPTAENTSYNNVEFGLKMLVTNNIIAKLRKFDQKFTNIAREWFGDKSLVVYHDLTEFKELAPDLKLLKEVYGDASFIKLSEKRRLFNWDDDNENSDILDKYYIQSGWQTLESLSVDMEPDNEQTGDYDTGED